MILALSDIHFNLSILEYWLEYKNIINFVLVSGDLSRNTIGLKEVLEHLSYFKKVFVIPGNNEKPEDIDKYNFNNIINVHDEIVKYREFTIYGFGGSPITPFKTRFEWDDRKIEKYLTEKIEELKEYKNKIFLFHSPPKNSIFDIYGKLEGGSYAVKKIYESLDGFFIFGHIHQTQKFIDIKGINPGNGIMMNPRLCRK